MREQYIRQVEKELPIPRRAKREVIRDLREIFASALEHGETEQQVIGRLGTPREFAESTAEQLGIDITTSQNQKSRIWGIAALTAAAAALAGLVSDEELCEDFIMPDPFDPRIVDVVSKAVKDHIAD